MISCEFCKRMAVGRGVAKTIGTEHHPGGNLCTHSHACSKHKKQAKEKALEGVIRTCQMERGFTPSSEQLTETVFEFFEF